MATRIRVPWEAGLKHAIILVALHQKKQENLNSDLFFKTPEDVSVIFAVDAIKMQLQLINEECKAVE